jgi:rhodanese-related sulfurtransferase
MGLRSLSKEICLLCLVALLPAAAAALWHPRRPAFVTPPLGPGEVHGRTARMWGPRVLWVDARSEREFDKGHVPGALPLTEDQWDQQLKAVIEAWDESRIVVVYCASDLCRSAHDVADRLRREMQWNDVYVLQGGWVQWQRMLP